MQKLTTFFMFVGEQHGKAEEAMRFYVSLFPDSAISHVERYGPGEVDPEGTLKYASFTLAGQEFMAIDSGYDHQFGFTPAVSVHVRCESEAEIDALYARLSEGGMALMPLGDYGFGQKYAWVADRYGVTWQLRLD